MKAVRVLLRVFAADILSMFINMTLAGSRSTAVRIVCLVCTALILVTVLADFSIKEAHDDVKNKRSIAGIYAAGVAAAVPAFLSWMILCISVKSGNFDFYRWHKLINAPFLQYYNLIESDVTSAALSSGELKLMLLPVFLMPFAVMIPYFSTRKCGEKEN